MVAILFDGYRMHHLVRANYERGIPVDKSFLRKTARLVQKYTQAGEVEEPTAIHTLGEELLHLKIPNHGKLFKLLLKVYLGAEISLQFGSDASILQGSETIRRRHLETKP